MYDLSREFGESCYRLLSRTGQFIYLRTRGYLEIQSNCVSSFICINTLVTEDEGKKLIREMKKKLSVKIQGSVLARESEVPAVENEQKIQDAVMNLVTNLPDHVETKVENTPNIILPEDESSQDDDKYSTYSSVHDSSEKSDLDHQPKSPFAIIAPNTNAIKTSIIKTTSVINVAVKNSGSQSPAYIGSVESGPKFTNENTDTSASSSTMKRPSVLQKSSTITAPHTSTSAYALSDNSSRNNIQLDRSNICKNLINADTIKVDTDSYGSSPTFNYNPTAASVSVPSTPQNFMSHQIKQEYTSPLSSPPQFNPNQYQSSYYNSPMQQQQLHQSHMSLSNYQQHQHHLLQQQQQPQFTRHVYSSVITSPQSLQSPTSIPDESYYQSPQHPAMLSPCQRRDIISQGSSPSLKRSNYMDDYGSDKEKLTKRRMYNIDSTMQSSSIYSVQGSDLQNINQSE